MLGRPKGGVDALPSLAETVSVVTLVKLQHGLRDSVFARFVHRTVDRKSNKPLGYVDRVRTVINAAPKAPPRLGRVQWLVMKRRLSPAAAEISEERRSF